MAEGKSGREKELEELRGKGLTRGFREKIRKSQGAPLSTPEQETAFLAAQRAAVTKKEKIAPAKHIKSVAELGRWHVERRARDSAIREKVAETKALMHSYRGSAGKSEQIPSLPSVADVRCKAYEVTTDQSLQQHIVVVEENDRSDGDSSFDGCVSPTTVIDSPSTNFDQECTSDKVNGEQRCGTIETETKKMVFPDKCKRQSEDAMPNENINSKENLELSISSRHHGADDANHKKVTIETGDEVHVDHVKKDEIHLDNSKSENVAKQTTSSQAEKETNGNDHTNSEVVDDIQSNNSNCDKRTMTETETFDNSAEELIEAFDKVPDEPEINTITVPSLQIATPDTDQNSVIQKDDELISAIRADEHQQQQQQDMANFVQNRNVFYGCFSSIISLVFQSKQDERDASSTIVVDDDTSLCNNGHLSLLADDQYYLSLIHQQYFL